MKQATISFDKTELLTLLTALCLLSKRQTDQNNIKYIMDLTQKILDYSNEMEG